MRYWIGCHSGNPLSPVGLRPEILTEGYGWLHRLTLAAIDEGLEPVWSMPFGCAHGSVNPTSCGVHAAGFRDLMRDTDSLRSYAVLPRLFVGVRSHDPCKLSVPNDARWLDPLAFKTDAGNCRDNFGEWSALGVPGVIFDNASAAMDKFGSLAEFMRDALSMESEVEGIPFRPDGSVDDRWPSVHTDYVMDRSHPNAVGPASRNAHVWVQWGPGKTKDQVIDAMRRWSARGFVIDYQGVLDPDVLNAWKEIES